MKSDNHRFRSGSEAKVRSIFAKELTDFFEQMVRPDGDWPGIKNDDLIGGIIEAVQNTAKKIPDGMGVGLLHGLAYTALDAVSESMSEDSNGPSEAMRRSALSEHLPSDVSFEKIQPSYQQSGNSIDGEPEHRAMGDLEAVSPLRAMGYTVAEDALTEKQRRSILRKSIKQESLDPEGQAQGDLRWGQRNTPDRLEAIVNHLFWLARLQGTEKPGAKERWLSDIEWLKQSFSDLGKEIDWTLFAADNIKNVRRAPNAALMTHLTPSPALAAIVGRDPLPRTEVTKKVWEYIKKHRLQDDVNKRAINADRKLLKIFGSRQVSMFELTKIINSHLKS